MGKRFVNPEKLKQIDIGEGDWIKVPEKISYTLLEEIGAVGKGRENMEDADLKTITKVVKEWSLEEENGEPAEITLANVKRIDLATLRRISDELGEIFKDLTGEEEKKD